MLLWQLEISTAQSAAAVTCAAQRQRKPRSVLNQAEGEPRHPQSEQPAGTFVTPDVDRMPGTRGADSARHRALHNNVAFYLVCALVGVALVTSLLLVDWTASTPTSCAGLIRIQSPIGS